MRTLTWITGAALFCSLAGCMYNPALPENPFWCGEGGKCPDGYECYGGVCRKERPACMDPVNISNPMSEFYNWPDDGDLEPNNVPDLAVTLPCGDDPYADPTYGQRCPTRENYTNGFMNLVICPSNDQDVYRIYLLPDETITFQVLYQYSDTLPRDIDAQVVRWDYILGDYVEVAVGTSTNDNETITISTETTSGNPQGWYYLIVYGKIAFDQFGQPMDRNFYSVSFTLNPSTT